MISKLVKQIKNSPCTVSRNGLISKVIIACDERKLPAEKLGSSFLYKVNKKSAHYVIGDDDVIINYVDEKLGSKMFNNILDNERSISILVSNGKFNSKCLKDLCNDLFVRYPDIKVFKHEGDLTCEIAKEDFKDTKNQDKPNAKNLQNEVEETIDTESDVSQDIVSEENSPDFSSMGAMYTLSNHLDEPPAFSRKKDSRKKNKKHDR